MECRGVTTAPPWASLEKPSHACFVYDMNIVFNTLVHMVGNQWYLSWSLGSSICPLDPSFVCLFLCSCSCAFLGFFRLQKSSRLPYPYLHLLIHSEDQYQDAADTSEDDPQDQNHTGEVSTYWSSMDNPTDYGSDKETVDEVDLCLRFSNMCDDFVFHYYHLDDFESFGYNARNRGRFHLLSWIHLSSGLNPGKKWRIS